MSDYFSKERWDAGYVNIQRIQIAQSLEREKRRKKDKPTINPIKLLLRWWRDL